MLPRVLEPTGLESSTVVQEGKLKAEANEINAIMASCDSEMSSRCEAEGRKEDLKKGRTGESKK